MWYELCEPITWIWFNRGSPAAALAPCAQQTTAQAKKPTRPPSPVHAMSVILINGSIYPVVVT
jgi:hypothetical protein